MNKVYCLEFFKVNFVFSPSKNFFQEFAITKGLRSCHAAAKLKWLNKYYIFLCWPKCVLPCSQPTHLRCPAEPHPSNGEYNASSRANNSLIHWLQNQSRVGRHEEHLNFSISTGKDILTGMCRNIVENKNCTYLIQKNLQHFFLINVHSWHKMIRKPIGKNCGVKPSFLGVIVNDRQITLNV